MNDHIFISHSTEDDEFVKELRETLKNHGVNSWVDSRQLKGGDELLPEIQSAIESAAAFLVVMSPHFINSPWIRTEIKHALKVKEDNKDFPVIPLLRDGVEPSALTWFFQEELVAIRVRSGVGGISEAVPYILAALGMRLPDDTQKMKQVPQMPLEELVLELTSPQMVEIDGKQRAQATAKLKYIPSEKGKDTVECDELFLFTSPMGPIESDDLKWYLERYYLWPHGVFRGRAQDVEKKLPIWGQALFDKTSHMGTGAF